MCRQCNKKAHKGRKVNGKQTQNCDLSDSLLFRKLKIKLGEITKGKQYF